MVAVNVNIKKNIRPTHVCHHLRKVVNITCPCMEIFHGMVSRIRWRQLLGLVLPGRNSDARGESPRTLPAVHDISVCSATPSQVSRRNIRSSAAVSSLGDMVSPCRTPLLMLTLLLYLCTWTRRAVGVDFLRQFLSYVLEAR